MQKTPIQSELSGPGYERIDVALETILASEKFVAAPQMSAFLRYVVTQAATGNKHRIKAYSVAVDALGKPETFDPQNDPVVRVLAGRLRSTLSAYYDAHQNEDLIIDMQPGSYVPRFITRKTSAAKSTGTGSKNQLVSRKCISPKAAQSPTHAENAVSAVTSELTDLHDEQPSESTSAAANRQWHQDSVEAHAHSSRLSNEDKSRLFGNMLSSQYKSALQGARRKQYRGPVSSINYLVRRYPRISFCLAILASLLLGMSLSPGKAQEGIPLANNPGWDIENGARAHRPRPDTLSLFVSAMEPTNTLASQLNTMMSGVFSEAENIRVYRMLPTSRVSQYWPEDYLISLSVLPLSEETQVSVQVVDAQTGRITHSEILHLGAYATEELSMEEMRKIMDFARRLINTDGPLIKDYVLKTNNREDVALDITTIHTEAM